MSTWIKIKSWLGWLDNHIVLIMAAFLLAFIPLYPKIPLWSPIEQYIVRVRLEDIFILITGVVWLVQVVRKKVRWLSPMFWVVLSYAVVGLLSALHAMYVIQTVPLQPLHIGKTVLHYFRYLEYFSLFFFLFSAVKTRQHIKIVLAIFTLTVMAIVMYGYGQKYFFWPVYSTMNREFSKGMRLYLTQYARVQSTFAGHYDMAAYLVVALPMLLALAYRTKVKLRRWGIFIIFYSGVWLLILSASRIPFAAALVGIGLVVLLTALGQAGWGNKFRFAFTKGTTVLLIFGLLFYYFGTDLSERLGYLIQAYPQTKAVADAATNARRMVINDETLNKLPLTPKNLQAMLPKAAQPPSSSVSTDDLAAQLAAAAEEADATKEVASSADQPPLPVIPTPEPKPTPPPLFKGPADVKEQVPDIVEVVTIGPGGETQKTKVKRARVYSDCALKKELSLCIRLETLWPRAIESFLESPILGTGYATLTKESVYVFTEADSTDNNFLRTLGETGILGFITFYGAVGVIIFYAAKNLSNPDNLAKAMSVGIMSGSIGLLLNAIYIDVFAASKVAQSYWALSGLFMGYVYVLKNETQPAIAASTPQLAKALTQMSAKTQPARPARRTKAKRNRSTKKSA